MLSIIVPNTEEATVIALTVDNLQRELRSIPGGSEVIIADSWAKGILDSNGDYICLVEPDCLVSSSYFSSNVGLFQRNYFNRKLAMIASCLGVRNWGNRIYNYRLEKVEDDRVSQWRIRPERLKRATGLYNVQVGFLPGAIIRRSVFDDKFMKQLKHLHYPDLVELSTKFSFNLWGSGRRVMVNPNTTYVSTDKSLEDPPPFSFKAPGAVQAIFEQERL